MERDYTKYEIKNCPIISYELIDHEKGLVPNKKYIKGTVVEKEDKKYIEGDWVDGNELPGYQNCIIFSPTAYIEKVDGIETEKYLRIIPNECFRDERNIKAINTINADIIGRYSFYDCINLEEVNFGAEVIAIDGFAFFHCKNIKELVFKDGIKYIGNYAFNLCSGLKKISIGEVVSNMKEIGKGAFANCTSLDTIECHVLYTETSGDEKSIPNIKINDLTFMNIKVGGKFYYPLSFSNPNQFITESSEEPNFFHGGIYDLAFYQWNLGAGDFDIVLPVYYNTVDDKPILDFDDEAFQYTTLDEVKHNLQIFSNSYDNINKMFKLSFLSTKDTFHKEKKSSSNSQNKFYEAVECTGITSVENGIYGNVDNNIFHVVTRNSKLECYSEPGVEIDNIRYLLKEQNEPKDGNEYWVSDGNVQNVDTINTLFVHTINTLFVHTTITDNPSDTLLEEFISPSSVKTIGENAFCGCKELRLVILNDGITEIKNNAFNSCVKLVEIYNNYKDSYIKSGSVKGNVKAERIGYSYWLPIKLETIGDGVFAGAGMELDDEAESESGGEDKRKNELPPLPAQAIYEDDNGFSCKKGISIMFYSNIKSIGADITKGSKVRAIRIENNNNYNGIQIQNNSFIKDIDSYLYVYLGSDINYNTEDETKKTPFSDNNYIYKLELGNNFGFKSTDEMISKDEEYYKYLLSNCENLRVFNWDLPQSTAFRSIPDYMFYNCKKLQSINITSNIQIIKDHAFDGCDLREIKISHSLDDKPIQLCTSIPEDFPTEISDSKPGVFKQSTNLEVLSLYRELKFCENTHNEYNDSTEIEITKNCLPFSFDNIEEININDRSEKGFKIINYHLFEEIPLEEISMYGIDQIQAFAFYKCTNLSTINCYMNKGPQTDTQSFSGIFPGGTLKVPSMSKETYSNMLTNLTQGDISWTIEDLEE